MFVDHNKHTAVAWRVIYIHTENLLTFPTYEFGLLVKYGVGMQCELTPSRPLSLYFRERLYPVQPKHWLKEIQPLLSWCVCADLPNPCGVLCFFTEVVKKSKHGLVANKYALKTGKLIVIFGINSTKSWKPSSANSLCMYVYVLFWYFNPHLLSFNCLFL